MRRPLDVAELHLVGRVHRPHVDGERDLQKAVVLLPVDVAMKFQFPGRRVETDDLRHLRFLADGELERHFRA
jgi:hypothetical protein